MKTFGYILVIISLISISCTQQAEQHNTLSKQEKSEGWMLLFDGENMDQWRSYLKDHLTGWIVEDGCMKALGLGGDEGGDIITLEEFKSFELSMEWKIAPEGNSGILYLVHEDTSYRQVYHTGPEFQLLDDLGWPKPLGDLQKTGANYAMHVAVNPDLKPAGEWNTARILKDGSKVEHWLNGKMVVEYELWTEDWKSRVENGKWNKYPGYGQFKTGHISLQDHGAQAWFRNVKIREI